MSISVFVHVFVLGLIKLLKWFAKTKLHVRYHGCLSMNDFSTYKRKIFSLVLFCLPFCAFIYQNEPSWSCSFKISYGFGSKPSRLHCFSAYISGVLVISNSIGIRSVSLHFISAICAYFTVHFQCWILNTIYKKIDEQ